VALLTIAAVAALGLVALVGTSAGKADDENIAPDLSFYGPPSNDQTGLHAPYGMAFDQDRNLWVVNNRQQNESIVMYDEGSQNQSGTINQPPTVTLKINKLVVGGTPVEGPYSLDFDSIGNLWVGTENVGLMRIPKSRLGASGQVSPDCKIKGPFTKTSSLYNNAVPKQIAVHPADDNVIFVANAGTNSQTKNQVLVFDISNGCGDIPPAWYLTGGSTSPALVRPFGLAIDPKSTKTATTFWVAGADGKLQRYSADISNFKGKTSLNAQLSIIGGSTQMNMPHGIAIGPAGNIWVTNPNQSNSGFEDGSVTVYSPSGTGTDDRAPIRRIIGNNTKIDDASGITFDWQGRLWLSNPDYQSGEGNAVRRYAVGGSTPAITVTPIPVPSGSPTPTTSPNPTSSPNPSGSPNPTSSPTPTISPTPSPNPRSPYLIVKARPKADKLIEQRRTKIVRWEGTDGVLVTIQTDCFLKGQKLTGKTKRQICDIEAKKRKVGASTAGSKTIWASPPCTNGLKYKSRVVAKFPGFPGSGPESWQRSWKVKNQPKSDCRIPSNG
jgi:hypothetical protein